MKNVLRRITLPAVIALALIFVVPPMQSADGDGGQCHFDIVNNYYSDNTYSSAVAWDERDCSCSLYSAGSTTSWRYHEVYTCDMNQVSASCQEYQGSGWVNVACPDPGVTALVRIHIPVG